MQEDNQRFAVIDIGTNTFHLLIAQPDNNGFGLKEIYRSRQFIKLAESGIDILSPAALRRGMEALHSFRRQLDHYAIPQERVMALGTAALRTASNGPAFRSEVKELTNIDIQIISGDREAQLIAKGALMAIPSPREKVLIMDIGGGSVEFIIADQQQVYWAQSFPIGVAVLYRQFHHNEPIDHYEIEQVRSYLSLQLQPLAAALQTFNSYHLIGAAGTFDVVGNHLGANGSSPSFTPVDLKDFDLFFKQVLRTTRQERLDMPEIPEDRADMIVVAFILIDLVLQLFEIRQLTVSYYAMKEGMMSELFKKTNSRDQ